MGERRLLPPARTSTLDISGCGGLPCAPTCVQMSSCEFHTALLHPRWMRGNGREEGSSLPSCARWRGLLEHFIRKMALPIEESDSLV